MEKIIKELEFYKIRVEEQEKQLKSQDYTEKINEISEILTKKLEILNKREVELNDFEQKLQIEREEVNKTANLVSGLNQELLQQKNLQKAEELNLEMIKERIQRIGIKQNEREELLQIQEKEIRELRNKLKETEQHLYEKEKSISSIEHTNSIFSQDSPIPSLRNEFN